MLWYFFSLNTGTKSFTLLTHFAFSSHRINRYGLKKKKKQVNWNLFTTNKEALDVIDRICNLSVE